MGKWIVSEMGAREWRRACRKGAMGWFQTCVAHFEDDSLLMSRLALNHHEIIFSHPKMNPNHPHKKGASLLSSVIRHP